MIYFSFYFFHHIPSGSEVYRSSQLVFGSIAFKLFNVLGSLPQASHNKLGELWPIPPDRAGVTESGLFSSLLAHAFSVLPTNFL